MITSILQRFINIIRGNSSPKASPPINPTIPPVLPPDPPVILTHSLPSVSKAGVDLIKQFEGNKLTSYLCPANVWTIGYGATGPDIRAGMTWTQEKCEDRLTQDLIKFSSGVALLTHTPISSNQLNAFVCLAYNIGLEAFRKSTALHRFNSGDIKGAAEAILMWDKAKVNGKAISLLGLRRRREEERRLFLS